VILQPLNKIELKAAALILRLMYHISLCQCLKVHFNKQVLMYIPLNIYGKRIADLSIYAFITFTQGLFPLSAMKFIGELG